MVTYSPRIPTSDSLHNIGLFTRLVRSELDQNGVARPESCRRCRSPKSTMASYLSADPVPSRSGYSRHGAEPRDDRAKRDENVAVVDLATWLRNWRDFDGAPRYRDGL